MMAENARKRIPEYPVLGRKLQYLCDLSHEMIKYPGLFKKVI
jgi:hypothetical protein